MKKKIFIFLILLSVLVILFLTTNLYLIFLKPLNVGIDIDKKYGDVILVLGGGLRPRVEFGYSTKERLDLAVAIFKQRSRPILLTDGSLYQNSPAIGKMKEYFKKCNIDEAFILFEGKSQNTYESGINSKQIIDEKKMNQVIVCTSPYHQKRSRMILSHLNFRDFKIARMRNSEIFKPGTIKQRLRNIKLITREYFAILKFTLQKK